MINVNRIVDLPKHNTYALDLNETIFTQSRARRWRWSRGTAVFLLDKHGGNVHLMISAVGDDIYYTDGSYNYYIMYYTNAAVHRPYISHVRNNRFPSIIFHVTFYTQKHIGRSCVPFCDRPRTRFRSTCSCASWWLWTACNRSSTSTSRRRDTRTGRRSRYSLSAWTTGRNSCWAPARSPGETVCRRWSGRCRRLLSSPLVRRRPWLPVAAAAAAAGRVHLGETRTTTICESQDDNNKKIKIYLCLGIQLRVCKLRV